jgi:hypothetical protein
LADRWETSHGLNPRSANAHGDKDHDGLDNRAEFRARTDPRDEDTDGDGMDDGDEAHDRSASTRPTDRDTDDDGTLDGDEDADHDSVANEDEDDAREACVADDDDRDGDHVDDEDENDLGLRAGRADSDADGVLDGAEDADHDGVANEDEDDHATDRCDGDRDHDGVDDEDAGDLLGTIASYDAGTGQLTLTTTEGVLSYVVTAGTEIEVQHGETDGTVADLVAGARVAEVHLDHRTGALEEVELYAPRPTDGGGGHGGDDGPTA